MKPRSKDTNASIRKTIRIIESFSEDSLFQSIDELSKKTGFPKTTVHRIVTTLADEGWMMQDTYSKRYGLGYGLLGYEKLIFVNENLVRICDPVMRMLRDKSNETIALGILEKDRCRCIHKIESEHHIKLTSKVGKSMPLYAGATAKCILAFQEEEFIRDYIENNKLVAFTQYTNTDKNKLIKELDSIRRRGYATSQSEVDMDTFTVSIPLFKKNNISLGSVSISCPMYRYSNKLKNDMIKLAKMARDDLNKKIKGVKI